MTVDEETETRILDKAEHVEQSVTFLSQKQALDRQEYCSDWEQQASRKGPIRSFEYGEPVSGSRYSSGVRHSSPTMSSSFEVMRSCWWSSSD